MRLILIISIFCFTKTFSQLSKDQLTKKETELLSVKKKLTDSLEIIETRLERIRSEKELLESKKYLTRRYFGRLKSDFDKITGYDAYMMSEPLFGEKIPLQKGQILEFMDTHEQKIKVHAENKVGYVWKDQIDTASDLNEFLIAIKLRDKVRAVEKEREFDSLTNIISKRNDEERKSAQLKYEKEQERQKKEMQVSQERQKKEMQVSLEKKRAYLIQEYGASIALKILNHEYWLGMKAEQARESLGSPGNINESVGSWGVNQQWVYSNLNLYFENGVLTSFQKRH